MRHNLPGVGADVVETNEMQLLDGKRIEMAHCMRVVTVGAG